MLIDQTIMVYVGYHDTLLWWGPFALEDCAKRVVEKTFYYGFAARSYVTGSSRFSVAVPLMVSQGDQSLSSTYFKRFAEQVPPFLTF